MEELHRLRFQFPQRIYFKVFILAFCGKAFHGMTPSTQQASLSHGPVHASSVTVYAVVTDRLSPGDTGPLPRSVRASVWPAANLRENSKTLLTCVMD